MEMNVRKAFSFIHETYDGEAKNPIYIMAIKNNWTSYDDLPECQSDLCHNKRALTKKGRAFSKSCGDSRCANRITALNTKSSIDYHASSEKRKETIKQTKDQISLDNSRYRDHSFEEIQSIVQDRTPLYFRSKESYELLVKIEDLTSFLPIETTTHQRINCIRKGITENPLCSVCGTEVICHPHNGFSATCSQRCASIKSNETFKHKNGAYSIESPDIKRKAANGLKKYLSDKDRLASTQHKRQQRQIEKNGRPHYNQVHLSQEAYDLLSCKEKLEYLYKSKGAYWIENKYDIPNQTVYRYLQYHEIDLVNGNRSASERLIEEFINSLGFQTEAGNRSILDGKEIDIYIPFMQLGIEFNGLYWHSTKVLDNHTAYTMHLDKTKKAQEKGVRLIHIFEDEWLYREDLVKKKLKTILGLSDDRIGARKTTICNVALEEAKHFMEANHIQGSNVKAKVRLGLRDSSGRLVALMYFKRIGNTWDLCRYATSCLVVGGFTKLLKHFEEQYNPKEIVSFADLRWSQGELYYKCGFELDKVLLPSYYYVHNNQRIRKEKFRHARMKKMTDFDYDPNETEKENTERNGYHRIYDCGLMRFKKKYLTSS